MDLSDTDTMVTLLAGLAIVVGLLGIIVPVLPGLVLCWAGVVVWAVFGGEGGIVRWVVLAVASVIAIAGVIAKYAWPGRNLKRNGVPNLSLIAGGLLGLVGFFVVPVIGLVLGFVLGVFLAELVRVRTGRAAWQSTKHALKAAGLSMLIELAAGLGITAAWVVGLLTT